jgi:hypothetical protein
VVAFAAMVIGLPLLLAVWVKLSLTLVMSGEVPSPELREAAVRIAEAEAALNAAKSPPRQWG